MANIESYLNQRMYDETVDDLAKNHNLNRLEDSSDDDSPSGSPGAGQVQIRHNYHSSQAALVGSAPSFIFPKREVLRQGRVASIDGPDNDPDGQPDPVRSWLAKQDFRSDNSFAFKRNMLSGGGSPTWNASRRPMMRSRPLTIGNWKDRCMAWLAALNSSIPIFSPFSTGRKLWESFIMVLVLYNAVTVPLDVSYGMPTNGNIALYIEYAVDLVFAIDIACSFRTAFVDSTGYLVRDTGAIAKNYLKIWFWIDLFATIPYDLLAEAVLQGNVSSAQVTVLGFLRTPRLLRLGRLIRMLDRLKSVNLIRVILVMATMMLISHWLACIWYMLFKFTTFADHAEWGIFLGGMIDAEQAVSAYLSAFYQSFLMMVGNNQTAYNNLERLFMILVLIMGACFYSAMVGQMAVLVANMNTVALRHRMKQDTTLDVLRYLGLPEAQLIRVQNYFSYIMQVNHPAAEGLAFLNDLPKALLEDITSWLYGNRLSKVPLFASLEPAFLSSLALRMRIVSFTPKETIFKEGDLGIEMYIIRKGSVAVVGKHNQMLAFLGEGDYFGEIAMFTMAKRTAKCVALANCDLCVLNTYDLKLVMKDFPTSSQALTEKAHQKLRQLQVAGRAAILDTDEDEDAADDLDGDPDQDFDFKENDVMDDDPDNPALLVSAGDSPDGKGPSDPNSPETGAISGRQVRRASIGEFRRSSIHVPRSAGATGAVSEGLEQQGLQLHTGLDPFLVTIHEDQDQLQSPGHSSHLVPGGVGKRRRQWLAGAAMAVWRAAQRSGSQPVAEGSEDMPSEHDGPATRRGSFQKARGLQDNALMPKPRNSFRNTSLPHSVQGLPGSAPANRLAADSEDDGTQEWLRTALSGKGSIRVLNSTSRGLGSGLTPDALQASQKSRLGTDSPSGLMSRGSLTAMHGKKSTRSSATSVENYMTRPSPNSGYETMAHLQSHRYAGSVDGEQGHVADGTWQQKSFTGPRRSSASMEAEYEGALANSKSEAALLKQELADVYKALNDETDMRKILFRHLVSLLQLLEGISMKVEDMESWMHDVEGHVKRMEVAQHGTSNVLGAHIDAGPQPRQALSKAISKRASRGPGNLLSEPSLNKKASMKPDTSNPGKGSLSGGRL